MNAIVLKFGGASLSTPKKMLKVADIIIERKKELKNIVVIVSAMGDTTDKLLKLARKIHTDPPKREQDMLISVGERISMSLLSMALQKKGINSISFTGSQSGIITCDNHFDAKIIDVKPFRIIDELKNNKIVIVAGFQGISQKKEITTLGRGGSDTSAVAIASAIEAESVDFYKDVMGIYNKDPKENKDAVFFNKLNYDESLKIITSSKHFLLHPRALELAKQNNIKLIIRSFKKNAKKFTSIENDAFKKDGKIVYEKV
ncbi:MAG: aspartate kinase [Chlamydiae bacterium RIFCSPHIGHO2_12_FULL_27_8]|nr:MAG: aspartate kinase [Chlamydiae bacterium RIFCSPHIGHO2_12_FULL_27_8]OGN66454.1 MAG: aspartate kinase [Chlamydiae bacterium RIFCSPLOWO2_01_FULL_28_7]